MPFACPVVVVRLYTKPGWNCMVKLPPVGVTSATCANCCAGSAERRLVAQTCTGPVDSPPVTVNVALCGAVASTVSTMVL